MAFRKIGAFSLIIGILGSLLIMGILYSLPAAIWDSQAPATCLSSGCFCEALQINPVKQPVNTWSSLAFLLPGAFILGTAHRINPEKKRLPFFWAYLIGVGSVLTGVGSAYYHASLTFTGQILDIAGMYLLAASMLVYAWQRLWGWQNKKTILIFILLNIFFTIIQIFISAIRRTLFAVILLIALVFESAFLHSKRPQIETLKLFIGLGLFAIAFGIWILDNSRILCNPTGLLQGHALWHLLGAVAVAFLYQYYLSEEKSHPL